MEYFKTYYEQETPDASQPAPEMASKDISPAAPLPDLVFDHRASWSFGPVSVEAEIGDGDIIVAVRILGIKIAQAKLDVDNPELNASASLFLVKAEISIMADFKEEHVIAKGTACYREGSQWKCQNFKSIILSW